MDPLSFDMKVSLVYGEEVFRHFPSNEPGFFGICEVMFKVENLASQIIKPLGVKYKLLVPCKEQVSLKKGVENYCAS
jgi:hypothetical protein